MAQSPQAHFPHHPRASWPWPVRERCSRGPTGTPISTSSAPLPAPGAWTRRPPFQLHVRDPTPLLCRHGSSSQENTEAAHLGLATAPSRDPRFGSREGIKKKKAGKRQKICRNSPSVKGTSILANAEVEKQQHLLYLQCFIPARTSRGRMLTEFMEHFLRLPEILQR